MYMTSRRFGILLFLCSAACGYASFDLEGVFYGEDVPSEQPTLYLNSADGNVCDFAAVDGNFIAGGRRNLVIGTHGWFERKAWCRDLAVEIAKRVDANEWVCGWFDWRAEARSINPTAAARYARDAAGPMLAEKVLDVSKDFRHVHLVGHSAGSWLISEAAKRIAARSRASIHLTFLDAYVPPRWDEKELADFSAEPNLVWWADHYLTRDITLKVTERWLSNAHNVDISDITPGLKDHEFPRYWYPATVRGEYLPGQRYKGKKLYVGTSDLKYGFARSLEAGEENWAESLSLPMGNKAVKVKKPKKPFEPLGWLFKRKGSEPNSTGANHN